MKSKIHFRVDPTKLCFALFSDFLAGKVSYSVTQENNAFTANYPSLITKTGKMSFLLQRKMFGRIDSKSF
jgi:hypothetical protein